MLKINPKVVDIYHGDNVSDFTKAYAAGYRGIIHKATEGSAMTDHAYGDRRKRAIDAGMLWGAYHFIRPGDPIAQAKRFVDAADPTPNTLLALDHEDPNVTLLTARQFLEAIEVQTGRKAVLYSGFLIKEQLANRHDMGAAAFLATHRLWLSHYSPNPKWPEIWTTPWLWQFTGDGQGPQPHDVPGLRTRIDINSYDGADDELTHEWAAG
jgi:GH25 family lysozyme M1 (1,4-beta-N-acetylmuramidase)